MEDKVLASLVEILIADYDKKGYLEINLNNNDVLSMLLRFYSSSIADMLESKVHYCGSFMRRVKFIISHWKVRDRYKKVKFIDTSFINKEIKKMMCFYKIDNNYFDHLKEYLHQ